MQASRLRNMKFGSEPLIFHAQGYHDYKPVWPKLRDWVFAQAPQQLGPRPRVTIITCNNGHEAMGLFESSVERLGIPYIVAGRQFPVWNNAEHKPLAILEALEQVETDYVLCADSRDAILAGDPELLVDRLLAEFPTGTGMVFGACQMSWPNAPDLSGFELGLPGAAQSEYKHLNGGAWIGERGLVRDFFIAARDAAPHPAAPESEQGKLRIVFPAFHPRVALDYGVKLFHNVGFVFEDTYQIVGEAEAA